MAFSHEITDPAKDDEPRKVFDGGEIKNVKGKNLTPKFLMADVKGKVMRPLVGTEKYPESPPADAKVGVITGGGQNYEIAAVDGAQTGVNKNVLCVWARPAVPAMAPPADYALTTRKFKGIP